MEVAGLLALCLDLEETGLMVLVMELEAEVEAQLLAVELEETEEMERKGLLLLQLIFNMRYAIVNDSTKVVENVIIWDGVSIYSNHAGVTIVNVDNIPCGPGWIQQSNGSFLPPQE